MENVLVGQKISKARIKLGMSTQELATRIGKSQATVSRIENGKQGVTLPLLMKIAKALRIQLFTLLNDGSEGDNPLQANGFFLQTILHAGRRRARLTEKVAAKQLDISVERLIDFETGAVLPNLDELERICTLYSIDAELINQIYLAEKQCPLLVSRLSAMNRLLQDCLDLLRDEASDQGRFSGLTKQIEHYLADLSCERQANYFSIGHISDLLMKALQDPKFHADCEARAKRWQSESTPHEKTQKFGAQEDLSDPGAMEIQEDSARVLSRSDPE